MLGDQFANTRMCKFFPMGKCTKGVQCPFAHDIFQLREQPNLRCTKLCKTMIKTGQCQDPTCTYAHNKQELRSAATQNPKKTKLDHNQFGSKRAYAHSPAEFTLPGLEGFPQLPPGLESLFCDDDADTTYVSQSQSNADSGDNMSDQDSTPTLGNDMGEPAYVNIGSSTDLGNLYNQLAIDSFTELAVEDAAVYSLGDFIGVDPAIALADFAGSWGMDPLTDYTNSAEYWHMDPMGEYHEQLHGWDWHGFAQNVVID